MIIFERYYNKKQIVIFIFALVHFFSVLGVGVQTATTGRNIAIPENQEKSPEKKNELAVLTIFTCAFIFAIYVDLFFRFDSNFEGTNCYNNNDHCGFIQLFFKKIPFIPKTYSGALTVLFYIATFILTGVVLGLSLDGSNLIEIQNNSPAAPTTTAP